jgi:hypothetical protein
VDWLAVLAGGLVAVVSSVVTHLLGNRRETRGYRRQLIETWRAMVARHVNSQERVIDDPDYASLRGHLTPEALKTLEHSGYTATLREGAEGISANPELDTVVTEIDRVEREWKLV